MLDVPRLGLDYLNGALTYVAKTAEDSAEFDAAVEIIENCKALVANTPLKQGLTATAKNSVDRLTRERDVQRSLMEVFEVRRMMA